MGPDREHLSSRAHERNRSGNTVSGPLLCPSCGTENTHSAFFCRECGRNFQVPDRCPSCDRPTVPNSDICESCGGWIGGNGCKFCGLALADGALFCPSCGNPREGVRCPSCDTVSFFDFCPRCNAPLTEAAREETTKASSDLKKLFDEKQDLKRLKEYLSSDSGTSAKAETSGWKINEKPAAVRSLMVFPSHQAARRYFMARKPEKTPGWICNEDLRLHASPACCAVARHGGWWVTENKI